MAATSERGIFEVDKRCHWHQFKDHMKCVRPSKNENREKKKATTTKAKKGEKRNEKVTENKIMTRLPLFSLSFDGIDVNRFEYAYALQ